MTDSHVLISFCERTITEANVNCIPEDWTHPFFEEKWVSYGFLLKRCKSRRLGFLPFMIWMSAPLNFPGLVHWFLSFWGPRIDLNMEYPYEWLRNPDGDLSDYVTSVTHCMRYGMLFDSLWLLLQAGARTDIGDFLTLNGQMLCLSQDDGKWIMYQKVALWYLDHGVADYNLPSACNWLRNKCLDYATRRSHCQDVTVRVGALLRHGRFGRWDRWLVRHVMQYVWATRRSAQWTPLLQ